MPAPLPKRSRKEKVGEIASAASLRGRLERLAALRGHGRVKTDKPAPPQPGANPKAVAAKARRAAKAEPAQD